MDYFTYEDTCDDIQLGTFDDIISEYNSCEDNAFEDDSFEDPDVIKYLINQPEPILVNKYEDFPDESYENKILTFETASILINGVKEDHTIMDLLAKLYVTCSFYNNYLNNYSILQSLVKNLNIKNLNIKKLNIKNKLIYCFNDLLDEYDKTYLNVRSDRVLSYENCLHKCIKNHNYELTPYFIHKININILNHSSVTNYGMWKDFILVEYVKESINNNNLYTLKQILNCYSSTELNEIFDSIDFIKLAAKVGNFEIFDLMSTYYSFKNINIPLYENAITGGNVDILNKLIERYGAFHYYGQLELAIKSGNPKMINRVIEILTELNNLPPAQEFCNYLRQINNIECADVFIKFLYARNQNIDIYVKSLLINETITNIECIIEKKIINNILYDTITKRNFEEGDTLLVLKLLYNNPDIWTIEGIDNWLNITKDKMSSKRIKEIQEQIKILKNNK